MRPKAFEPVGSDNFSDQGRNNRQEASPEKQNP
jgi:hypothetical protein